MYLNLFQQSNFSGFTYDAQLLLAAEKIKQYNSINYYGTLFSATLVLHLITKLIFNLCVEVKMPLDKWSTIDLLCSFFNIICFNVIGGTKPEAILDPN